MSSRPSNTTPKNRYDQVIEIKNSGNVLKFRSVYPRQNPDSAVDDITNGLMQCDVFKDLKP